MTALPGQADPVRKRNGGVVQDGANVIEQRLARVGLGDQLQEPAMARVATPPVNRVRPVLIPFWRLSELEPVQVRAQRQMEGCGS
jgi:hypothetical protein